MTFKEFIKTTEATVIFSGLLLSVLFGKFWIIATAIAYTVLNVPNVWQWIKDKFQR